MSMRPEDLARGRIQPVDRLSAHDDDLALTIDVDQDGRSIGSQKVAVLPGQRTVALSKRHHGLTFAPGLEDDGVLESQRVPPITCLDRRPNESGRGAILLHKIE